MPCSAMSDKKIQEVLLLENLGLKDETIAQMMQQLRSCLGSKQVCVIGLRNNRDVLTWSAEIYGANLRNKVDTNEELYIGTVQLPETDKERPICIISRNNFVHATPWHVQAWQVTDGDSREMKTNPYDYGEYKFTTAMTPHSLSKAMVTWYRWALTGVAEHRIREAERKLVALTSQSKDSKEIKKALVASRQHWLKNRKDTCREGNAKYLTSENSSGADRTDDGEKLRNCVRRLAEERAHGLERAVQEIEASNTPVEWMRLLEFLREDLRAGAAAAQRER